MGARPPFVPWQGDLVVAAVPVELLAPGLKAVWTLDRALDQGPEGAWISAAAVGARLGLAGDTAERYRRRLLELGLHATPADARAGRAKSWFAVLPVVPSRDADADEIAGCAAALVRHLGGSHERADDVAQALRKALRHLEPTPGRASGGDDRTPGPASGGPPDQRPGDPRTTVRRSLDVVPRGVSKLESRGAHAPPQRLEVETELGPTGRLRRRGGLTE